MAIYEKTIWAFRAVSPRLDSPEALEGRGAAADSVPEVQVALLEPTPETEGQRPRSLTSAP